LGLDGAARARSFDALGPPAARAVQCEPMPAPLGPSAYRVGLRRIGIWAGDIGDEEAAHRQPARDIGEIVGDRGGDILLGEQLKEAQARVIMVVARHRAGREAARDDMRAVRYRLWHVSPPLLSCSFSAPRRILRGARKGLRRVFSATTLLRRNKCRCPRAVLHDDPGLVLMVLNKRQQKDVSRLLEARQSAYNHCAIAPLLIVGWGLSCANAIPLTGSRSTRLRDPMLSCSA